MTELCQNPYCACDPCRCHRPCTCGLALVGRSYSESWDLLSEELVVADERRFAAVGDKSGDPSDHGPSDHGGEAPHTVELGDPVDLLAQALDREVYLSELDRQAPNIDHRAGHHNHPSVRRSEHQGHKIEIVTRYEISIDDQPLDVNFSVRDDGSVHYHGLPTYALPSAVDLVRQIIDSFPYDYPPADHDAQGEAD